MNKLDSVMEAGQEKRVQADIAVFTIALNLYRQDSGTFPSTEQGLSALVRKPTSGSVPRSYTPYMKDDQLDPWGKPYGYRWPAQKNAGKPDIWSSGPDQIDGTEDDIGNWMSVFGR